MSDRRRDKERMRGEDEASDERERERRERKREKERRAAEEEEEEPVRDRERRDRDRHKSKNREEPAVEEEAQASRHSKEKSRDKERDRERDLEKEREREKEARRKEKAREAAAAEAREAERPKEREKSNRYKYEEAEVDIYDDKDDKSKAAESGTGGGGSNRLLWDMAIDQVTEKELSTEDDLAEEKNLIIVGNQSSGKSSIVLRYTDRVNELPKPTIALDYTFCRKAKAGSSVLKNVGNIWELGEGTFLVKLIDVVVNPENIMNTSVMITVDLSKLSEMWITLETLIGYLRLRIKECIKEASKQNPHVKERLKSAILERLASNMDESKLEPIALPTVIVGTKYDVFETYEPEKKKIIARTLRFMAHFHGAALIFSSYKNELTVSKLKLLLNHFLLDGTFPNSSKYAQFEPIKPLFVPFGADNLEAIGLPALTNSELSDPSHRSLVDIWKTWFCKNFPQEESKRDPSLLEDYGKDPQFEEPIIDNLKDQKMRELENLRELLAKRRSQQSQSIKIEMN